MTGRDSASQVPDLGSAIARAQSRMAEARKHAEAGECGLALQTYDTLLEEAASCGPDAEEPLRRWVAAALRNRLTLLQREGRYEEGLLAVKEILARYGDQVPPEYPFLVGDALLSEAQLLRKLDRFSDTVRTYSAFAERFADSGQASVRVLVAAALSAQAEQLLRDARYYEVIETADDFSARFADEEAPDIQQHVTDAICMKAEALGKLSRWTEALDTDQVAIGRANDATGGAWPLAHMALSLSHLARDAEARSIWAVIVERFASDESPTVRGLVSQARGHLATGRTSRRQSDT